MTVDRDTYIEFLESIRACDCSVRWSKDAGPTFAVIWGKCTKPEWMIWMLERLIVNKKAVLLSCSISRAVLDLSPGYENRLGAALRVPERWAECEDAVSREELVSALATTVPAQGPYIDTPYFVARSVGASIKAAICILTLDDLLYDDECYIAAEYASTASHSDAKLADVVRAAYPADRVEERIQLKIAAMQGYNVEVAGVLKLAYPADEVGELSKLLKDKP